MTAIPARLNPSAIASARRDRSVKLSDDGLLIFDACDDAAWTKHHAADISFPGDDTAAARDFTEDVLVPKTVLKGHDGRLVTDGGHCRFDRFARVERLDEDNNKIDFADL